MTRLEHFNLNSNLTCNAHCTCRPEQNRIKEHNRVTWPSQTQTSAISEHANYTRHHLLLNKVKFINWDLQWYSHKVHEAIEIQIRLHPKNINSDSRIETPLSVDAYMVRKNTYTVAADWNHNGLLQGNSFVLQWRMHRIETHQPWVEFMIHLSLATLEVLMKWHYRLIKTYHTWLKWCNWYLSAREIFI